MRYFAGGSWKLPALLMAVQLITPDPLVVLRGEGERDTMEKKEVNHMHTLMPQAAAFMKKAMLVLDEPLTTLFPTPNTKTLLYLLKVSTVARH